MSVPVPLKPLAMVLLGVLELTRSNANPQVPGDRMDGKIRVPVVGWILVGDSGLMGWPGVWVSSRDRYRL